MDAKSWIIGHCVFAGDIRKDDYQNQPTPVPAQPQRDPNDPNVDIYPPDYEPEQKQRNLNPSRDLTIPAGQVLFHGSIEDFEESQLGIGGDGVLWTTDDKSGPAMAQSYIPRSGSSSQVMPRHIQQPSQDKSIQNLQKYIGIFYDYSKVVFDRIGRAESWSMPKKFDGSLWGFEELSPTVVDKLLKENGWQPKEDNLNSPEYNRYEILHGKSIDEIMPPEEIAQGRLFILKAQQPLKIYDYAGGREGDLMDVDYHKYDLFKLVESKGYDGIRINDFAQLHDWGNVGHQAIGIFKGSISKLKWQTIPAKHPTLNRLNDSTPEWSEYQKKQGPIQAWVQRNCKFAQQAEPWQTHRDEWTMSHFPNMTIEQVYGDEETYRKKRQYDRQWEQSMARAFSHGQVSKEDAAARKFWFNSNDTGELPQLLYHVATNKSKVIQEGLKNRDELNQSSGGGLGGGDSTTISFTEDLQIAREIKIALLEGRKVARGELTLAQMIEMARTGSGGGKPFLDKWFSYYFDQEPENGRGSIPRQIQYLMDGYKFSSFAWPTTVEEKNAKDPSPSEPWEGVNKWTSGDGSREIWSTFKRKLTPKEAQDGWFDMYKSFAAFRESAGGAMNPLFFGSDPEYLANVPEQEIGILSFKPKPGRQGYQVSSLGEWRTWAGDAVDFIGEVN